MTSGQAGARSDAGRVRGNNEDRWLVRRTRDVTLLAVADGVGGQEAGEDASAAAIETLAERFYASLSSGDARAALATAVRDANDAVVSGASSRGDSAASTLVACAVRKRQAIVANLGDSRAYLIRKRSARQVTSDHAGERPGQITRFLGDPRGVQPDVFVEMLRNDDRLVLCSDGLTRHVADDEIAAHAVRGDPLDAAGRLVALANERGGEDNVTVIVYRAGRPAAARYAIAVVVVLIAVLIAAAAIASGWPAQLLAR